MAGVKGKSGGSRQGSGRKSKADEQALVERLSPMDEMAFKALEAGVKRGDYNFLKLFFEYRFGKPADKVDLTSKGEALSVVFRRANEAS